jgi:protoheme ferro-lyase
MRLHTPPRTRTPRQHVVVVTTTNNNNANANRSNEHTLAYQSRVGPVEWLQPYTDDSIRELGRRGVKSLLAVPISFVSEHIETLEEIDMEYKCVCGLAWDGA